MAERVHVSEILRHFPQIHPTHSRSNYDPTGMIYAILYRKVPRTLPAKYQPNWPSGSGEAAFKWFLPSMGMAANLNFES